jgi:hypothetical protein
MLRMAGFARFRFGLVSRLASALVLVGSVTAVAVGATATGALPPASASVSAAACDGWTGYPTPNPASWNLLDGVAVTSASNAWATSQYQGGTGILHWNGKTWAVQSAPTGPRGVLTGIAATSGANAWAVGQNYSASVHRLVNMILHWNGTTWQAQSVPNPGLDGELTAVAATSASNAWAAGFGIGPTVRYQSQILHWNGRSWQSQSAPSPGTIVTELYGVAATSASNAWAVGYERSGPASQTVILHWNGHSWLRQATPSPSGADILYLGGVSATSATNAWAVGWYEVPATGATMTLILHWNGSSWSSEPAPAGVLDAVVATSASNAWAAGYYTNAAAQVKALALHWNGHSWSAQSNPNASASYSVLEALAATSTSDVWVAGRTGDNNFTARYC